MNHLKIFQASFGLRNAQNEAPGSEKRRKAKGESYAHEFHSLRMCIVIVLMEEIITV